MESRKTLQMAASGSTPPAILSAGSAPTAVSRPLFWARDVVPGLKRWTVLVQVVERSEIKGSRSSAKPVKYRNYIVSDMQGTRVAVVTYENNIQFFDATLIPFKRYYVSNAHVKQSKPGYAMDNYEHNWILNSSTLVEPLIDPIPFTLPCSFTFTPFVQFASLAGRDVSIAIKALVVHSFPWKEVNSQLSARDYIVVDESIMPVILKTWKNPATEVGTDLGHTLPEPLLIVATNVRVTTFHGLSLTTKYANSFLQDPPIHEDLPLKEWYSIHAAEVNKQLECKGYKNPTYLIRRPERGSIMSIAQAINTITEIKTAWVKGFVKVVPDQQSYWYMCFSNCNKAVRGDLDWSIWCEACKESATIELRYHLEISLTDETSTMCVTLYGSDAAELLPYTVVELYDQMNQDINVGEKIKTAIEGKHIMCYVKY